MAELIQFITQGSNDWTVGAVVGLMVFTIIFEGLFVTIGNIASIGRGGKR